MPYDRDEPVEKSRSLVESALNILAYTAHPVATLRTEAFARLHPNELWLSQITTAGFITGFVSGFYLSGRQRGLQFLAENAHRQPKTTKGWYMYHKYKNYEAIYSGTLGGARNGLKFGLIAAAFTVSEQVLEKYVTGGESWMCTTASGVLTGAGFSFSHGFTHSYLRSAVLISGGCGLFIGVLQDVYAMITGYSVKYMNQQREHVELIPSTLINRFRRDKSTAN
ncbi:hypothetical protein SmJEL517_g00685 [Synchytrium microbalum]|uniref:Uncharacterized protein n=1 Tax=Synchytrium microbalum TaxID=1806994 RepID=A0A507CIF7_9FUNG|nr:uncharacterized protein SmJEL517_g00685 [Synchytrium microbalum]TPX37433.1 hypothetical protein SmJEL517_g00685 [Synchytrium microbalum]